MCCYLLALADQMVSLTGLDWVTWHIYDAHLSHKLKWAADGFKQAICQKLIFIKH